ncbi:hypothetical protein VIBNISO65_200010 [Vibrio nigripulchritudo SO65]|nr:hypothetical protein VIBNIAM115_980010 [Vibrio nigripulchritudo AM115]CCN43065.1 hypothetical protein VIBNIFTn2_450010 [Vibrio nigripulchritudo FTn2]CCN67428.1 hypothetical protein VIBNIPon4_760010 [Vibrio nigripulchritudo POn4]CCN77175.1 hypothetical protein VIBNISO65_200010 [Vibrio nigripulchritudo SO65]
MKSDEPDTVLHQVVSAFYYGVIYNVLHVIDINDYFNLMQTNSKIVEDCL